MRRRPEFNSWHKNKFCMMIRMMMYPSTLLETKILANWLRNQTVVMIFFCSSIFFPQISPYSVTFIAKTMTSKTTVDFSCCYCTQYKCLPEFLSQFCDYLFKRTKHWERFHLQKNWNCILGKLCTSSGCIYTLSTLQTAIFCS